MSEYLEGGRGYKMKVDSGQLRCGICSAGGVSEDCVFWNGLHEFMVATRRETDMLVAAVHTPTLPVDPVSVYLTGN